MTKLSSCFLSPCPPPPAPVRPISRRIDRFLTCLSLLLVSHFSQAAQVQVNCNNNSGDAALINSAITGSSTGDEILIVGPGLINQPIRLLGSRSYRGTSRTGTVLKQANGANLVAVMASSSFLDNSAYTGSPMAVRHLTIDGNKANNTSTSTVGLIIRSWETVVEDIEVKQMRGDGIQVTSVSANGTGLSNTQVNGRVAGCIVNDCTGNGIKVKDSGNSCTDWSLLANVVQNSGGHGIHLENSAGWFVEQNEVINSIGHGIYADRCFAASITANHVQGFGRSSTSGTYYGVGATLQGNIGSVISGNVVENINQAGNTASTHRYISIIRVNYSSGYVSVTDNTATHSITTTGASAGLYYSKGSGTDLTVASSGNTAAGVATPKVVGSGVTANFGL